MTDKNKLRFDCRHFIGDRPCKFRTVCTCEHYAPVGRRILIIKLGALGDVVRTACLLPTLRKKYPDSQITWVSRDNGVRILQGHPMIDRLFEFNAENVFPLFYEKFDMVLSLDKERQPAGLCNALNSPDKRGMILGEYGTATYANKEAEYYFRLGVDDDHEWTRFLAFV
ncbi:MAG TPA: glycosyltransferase family 9 protein, partial [Phycisphaerae bacterium]|nr:glycosyltransferase family 9 protein [Phycisphaerae bacterium]